MPKLTRREFLKVGGVLATARLLGLPVETVAVTPAVETANASVPANIRAIAPAARSMAVPVLFDDGFGKIGPGTWLVDSRRAISLEDMSLYGECDWSDCAPWWLEGRSTANFSARAFELLDEDFQSLMDLLTQQTPAALVLIGHDEPIMRAKWQCYIARLEQEPDNGTVTISGPILVGGFGC